MTGVEIDFFVKDSLAALKLYESIFPVERIEVSGFAVGSNEAVFSIYGTRMHLLDENPDFHLNAPGPEGQGSMWLNVLVPDIRATFQKAMAAGCTELHEVTAMPEMGASNAIFKDPFGYIWMLHQIDRVVSHEERVAILEKKFGSGSAQKVD